MQKMRKDNQDNSKKRTYRLIPIKNIMETKELEARIRQLEAKLEEVTNDKEFWYKKYRETQSKYNSLKSALQSVLNLTNG